MEEEASPSTVPVLPRARPYQAPGALTVTEGVKVGYGFTLLVWEWPVSHAHPASRGVESNTVADRRPRGKSTE